MPQRSQASKLFIPLFIISLVFGVLVSNVLTANAGQPVATTDEYQVFLPIVLNTFPYQTSPFGIETKASFITNTALVERADELGTRWVRMNRISWKTVQPNQGDPLDWSKLADFENEIRALIKIGMTPVVIVDDYPHWAVIDGARKDGQPTSCAAIKPEYYDDFAAFMRALAARYKTTEFNVHHWEMGNEPDVDPNLVRPDNHYGCWGDMNDQYYGGERYGEMLKVVTPEIKAEDPQAQVWVGGLLLDHPNSLEKDPKRGRPELFLQGILEAGAEDDFDVVPYHWYPPFVNEIIDHDNALVYPYGYGESPWNELGGGTVGKAKFLKQILEQYQVDKPVFLNESGLICPEYYTWCLPPDGSFYQHQADYVVRSYVRGFGGGVMGFTWYTLEGPGWRYTGLLDGNYNPKPVYTAYQQMGVQLAYADYVGTVDFGAGIEAYQFSKGYANIHVVWAETDQELMITVPKSEFIGAWDRDGKVIEPTKKPVNYQIPVGFSPIYVLTSP
jgi:hypothetical protein